MTCCSMYVGDLKGFRWKGGNWDGNIPAGLTSEFPPVREVQELPAAEAQGALLQEAATTMLDGVELEETEADPVG